MKKINLTEVTVQTWVRTLILVIALANQAIILSCVSNREIEPDSWVSYAAYLLTVVSAVWSWWKNNSFTDAAQKADRENNLN